MTVLAKGVGATHLGAGTIDVLGYAPGARRAPGRGARRRCAAGPPVRARRRRAASAARAGWFSEAHRGRCALRLHGDRRARTCCCRPPSACREPTARRAGDDGRRATCARRADRRWSGFRALKDFYPALLADNLRRARRRRRRARASSSTVAPDGRGRRAARSALARALDDRGAAPRWPPSCAAAAGRRERVALPGRARARATPHGVWRDLQERLGRPVFEVPTLPPSVPGHAVYATLRDALRRARRARRPQRASRSAPSAPAAA